MLLVIRLMILILFIATARGSVLDKLSVGGGDLIVFVGLLPVLVLATLFLDLDICSDLRRIFFQPLPAWTDWHLISLVRFLIARRAIACQSLWGGRHNADWVCLRGRSGPWSVDLIEVLVVLIVRPPFVVARVLLLLTGAWITCRRRVTFVSKTPHGVSLSQTCVWTLGWLLITVCFILIRVSQSAISSLPHGRILFVHFGRVRSDVATLVPSDQIRIDGGQQSGKLLAKLILFRRRPHRMSFQLCSRHKRVIIMPIFYDSLVTHQGQHSFLHLSDWLIRVRIDFNLLRSHFCQLIMALDLRLLCL